MLLFNKHMENKIIMKRIALLLSIVMLFGCAQHDENGSVMYDEEGNEQIDGWKTAALVAGVAIATTGAVLMARNSHKWNMNGGGGYSSSQNDYTGPCQCPSDLDSLGHVCGARSAFSRSGGAVVSEAYCKRRAIENINSSTPLF